jgi:thioredoxin 1
MQVKPGKRIPFAHITSEKKFERIIKTAADTLLVFDLYADWCVPCKIVEPILKEVARENPNKAHYYKINIDMLPTVARAFRAMSIPLVTFVKNERTVQALAGVRPKGAYVEVIEKYGLKESQPAQQKNSAAAALDTAMQASGK